MTHESKQQKSTHLLFDGKKIIISPDIVMVFNFLKEIEIEIESFLGFDKKFEKLRLGYSEILKYVKFLGEKLKANDINFNEYNIKNPLPKATDFNIYVPVRSQMIVLFANLEVLYFLHIAYEKQIDDNQIMKDTAMKDKGFLKKFINLFLLTDDNDYYKKHKKRLSKIDSTKIRNLRNSLTHFFSVSADGLSIVQSLLDKKARRLENIFKQNKHSNVVFISPEDLFELIRHANIIMLKKWTNDFKNDRKEFKIKMQFVINIVEKYGVVIVPEKDLKV